MERKQDKLSGKTFLVVEDDQISSEYLREILDGYSVKLIFVNNGEDAVKVIKDNSKVDLVLMDIRLPGQNGYLTTREIKKLNNDLPIIAQTAYALEGDRQKAIDSGCNDYISKPIKASLLIDLISKYL